uniref:Putative secreted protein n=1 Tax=Anopheles triannulatus TaxID=58253 RepID=A0A2M4B703_9DIPT
MFLVSLQLFSFLLPLCCNRTLAVALIPDCEHSECNSSNSQWSASRPSGVAAIWKNLSVSRLHALLTSARGSRTVLSGASNTTPGCRPFPGRAAKMMALSTFPRTLRIA